MAELKDWLNSVNFTKENLIELSPIFILGMPRSGTTLVEQIVSSHSDVTGAGDTVMAVIAYGIGGCN